MAVGYGDPVQCAVYAPREAGRGVTILVQAYLFNVGQAREAAELASEADPDTLRRGLTTLRMGLRSGDVVRIQLRIPLPVDPPESSLIWVGATAGVQFEVTVPHEYTVGDIIGTVIFSIDRAPVGEIKFKLRITKDSPQSTAGSALAPANDQRPARYRRAFVSYSSRDLEAVERAIELLAIMGVDYFQDIRDLKPGQPWRPQLESAIDTCDVFLLFWSSNARESEEVRKETSRAVARLGPGGSPPPVIWPYVIEGPPGPPPPDELKDIHFGNYRYSRPRTLE